MRVAVIAQLQPGIEPGFQQSDAGRIQRVIGVKFVFIYKTNYRDLALLESGQQLIGDFGKARVVMEG